jgi:hypothetical protein
LLFQQEGLNNSFNFFIKIEYITLLSIINIIMKNINRILLLFNYLHSHNRLLLDNNCSNNQSVCINGFCNNTDCICYPSYTTYNSVIEKCNYKQYSAYNAYIFQGLFGYIGVGYFYVGLISQGFLQLIVFSSFIGLILLYTNSNIKSIKILFSIWIACFCFVPIIVIWWIYSLVQFKNLNINDINNVPLFNDI